MNKKIIIISLLTIIGLSFLINGPLYPVMFIFSLFINILEGGFVIYLGLVIGKKIKAGILGGFVLNGGILLAIVGFLTEFVSEIFTVVANKHLSSTSAIAAPILAAIGFFLGVFIGLFFGLVYKYKIKVYEKKHLDYFIVIISSLAVVIINKFILSYYF